MPSPILARADALMHRRRPGSPEPDDIPVLTDAVAGEDEIPTLLAEEPLPPPATALDAGAPETALDNGEPGTAPETAPGSGASADHRLFDELADELVKRVHARLATELPAIVDSSLRDLLADPGIVARLRARD